jgi:hypothetical protein
MKWGIKLPSLSIPRWKIEPPSPWVLFALIVSIISATFSAFNYFKSPPKARAALVVDRFEDHQEKANLPVLGEKNFHQLRMWITNNGQPPATIHNVAINPEFSPALMTPDHESQRMDYVAKNKATIGTTVNGSEIFTGQKFFYSANAGFPDETWSEFTSKKQFLYVFALISFSDEQSGNREVTTEICVRLETNLNNWNHCASGHNVTIRP